MEIDFVFRSSFSHDEKSVNSKNKSQKTPATSKIMSSISYNDSSPTGAMEAIDLDTSASGSGFFSGDPKKHDDLKAMLDSSKESLKLEGKKTYGK